MTVSSLALAFSGNRFEQTEVEGRMKGFKKKQMYRSEGSFLEDARVCLYCLFLRRSNYLRFFTRDLSQLAYCLF